MDILIDYFPNAVMHGRVAIQPPCESFRILLHGGESVGAVVMRVVIGIGAACEVTHQISGVDSGGNDNADITLLYTLKCSLIRFPKSSAP